MVILAFQTNNSAFRDAEGNLDLDMVAQTINSIADKIRAGRTEGPIMDYNGNKVGEYKVQKK